MIEILKPIKFTCSINDMVAYDRVSTVEQADEGAGIAAQRTAIKREAEYKSYNIVKWATDPGRSGKDTNRPGLSEAFEIIAAGHARGIIVSKLDRLSRSLLDFAGMMSQARIGGFNIVALDLGLDLSTPTGEMMASILAVFAQFERRVIGQRTRDGLAEKRAQGVRLGRPSGLSTEILTTIISARNEGMSLRYIADFLNDSNTPTPQGGARWYPSTVKGAYESQAAALVLAGMSPVSGAIE